LSVTNKIIFLSWSWWTSGNDNKCKWCYICRRRTTTNKGSRQKPVR